MCSAVLSCIFSFIIFINERAAYFIHTPNTLNSVLADVNFCLSDFYAVLFWLMKDGTVLARVSRVLEHRIFWK